MMMLPFDPEIMHGMLRDAPNVYRQQGMFWTAQAALRTHDRMYGKSHECEYCQAELLHIIQHAHELDSSKLFDNSERPKKSELNQNSEIPYMSTPFGVFVQLESLPDDMRQSIIDRLNGR